MYAWMGVCFGRQRSVWSVLSFVFYKKCVRVMSEREVGYEVVIVMSEREVGYEVVTERSTGG